MTKIAIVGTVGCGKTVLLSVLTHYFQQEKAGKQIIPENSETIKFCMEKWRYLSNGEWPEPTPPVPKPPIYKWTLRNGSKEIPLVSSDIAGEAWRKFILDHADIDDQAEMSSIFDKLKAACQKIPTKLKPGVLENHITTVENLLNDSSSILLLIDLKQIIDQSADFESAMILPRAIKKYMSSIGRAGIPITLVLVKTDQYAHLLNAENDWEALVKQYIPFIPKFDKIIPVAAVAQTKDGKPSPDFSSRGMDELFDGIWKSIGIGDFRTILRRLVKFLLIDVPILLTAYGIYLWLYWIGSSSSPAKIFFWVFVIIYALFKATKYATKKR